MDKNYTVIEDLTPAMGINDDNLIIVEDTEDTKRATVLDLKRAFTGDYNDPSDKTFYSSQKIEEYMNNINRQLLTLASENDLQSLSDRVKDLVLNSQEETGRNSEVVEACEGHRVLSDRLASDITKADNRFMKKINRVVEGKTVTTNNLDGCLVDIYLKNMSGNSANIIFRSKNILDPDYGNTATDEITYLPSGFRYRQLHQDTMSVSLKLRESAPKGKYYLFTNISYDAIFRDKGNIKFVIKNSKDESAYTEFIYNQSGKLEFEAPKAFNEIVFIFNQGNFVLNSTVTFRNMMITTDARYENKYVDYINNEVPIEKGQYLFNYNIDDYIISCSDPSASVVVSYYDQSVTTESMHTDIKELQDILIDDKDRCGLIKDYGKYLFFNNVECKNTSSWSLSYDNDKYLRNGVSSLKMTFGENMKVSPIFDTELTEYIETIDSVSLVFYVDKTTSYYFTTKNPITISLCSDNIYEPEMVNYLYTEISKDELVQGWNIIKKNINTFKTNGIPNIHGIKYARVEVKKNVGLECKSVYFNSIIFNQKMKPTVLLAFNGIYEEGFDFAYPYLTTREIPATILANNRNTFPSSVLNGIVNLRAKYGWDIGQYGCNPNKELLTLDDNPREQYLGLMNNKEWLQANLVYNPVSYSAPYGDLRPITVPILKDLGFKIAMSQSVGYCNFFDPEFDFTIPTQLMSNNVTTEEIISQLQYAVDNDCCVCLYTNNVTEYGSETDAKKNLLESVGKFIIDNKDNITPMTLSEFYNKCK